MGQQSTTKGTRLAAPTNPKAPRIYVADSNSAVESQVRAAGGVVIRQSYSPEQCIRDLESCDGLLITGGGDVNPAIYGQAQHKSVYGVTTSRDLRELAMLGAARDLGLPVLGICRGLQIINVEAGGSLYQNIPDNVGHDDHAWSMMPVITTPGSQVHRALGARPEMLHLHHQAVRKVAKGFAVTARHADGTVEAIESVDGRVIGVQFHPESVLTVTSAGHNGWALFDAFVATCARYRRRVEAKGRVYLPYPEKYVNAWPVAVEAHKTSWTTPAFKSATTGGSGGGVSPKGSSGESSADKRSAELEAKVGKGEGRLTLVRNSETSDQGIAAWCGSCGIAFDDENDWLDHTEWFLCGGDRRSLDTLAWRTEQLTD